MSPRSSAARPAPSLRSWRRYTTNVIYAPLLGSSGGPLLLARHMPPGRTNSCAAKALRGRFRRRLTHARARGARMRTHQPHHAPGPRAGSLRRARNTKRRSAQEGETPAPLSQPPYHIGGRSASAKAPPLNQPVAPQHAGPGPTRLDTRQEASHRGRSLARILPPGQPAPSALGRGFARSRQGQASHRRPREKGLGRGPSSSCQRPGSPPRKPPEEHARGDSPTRRHG